VLAAVSAVAGSMSPQQFGAYLAKDTKEWAEVVRASGLKLE
jgi:tripartite-type tricarboxylate transporter receptor subunit TctC